MQYYHNRVSIISLLSVIIFLFVILLLPQDVKAQTCDTSYVCKWTYSNNWCCNNYGQQWTSSPKGNNVCNTRYAWYEDDNNDCACSNGPWPWDLPYHSCTDVVACGICTAYDTQTETQTLLSCTSNPSDCQGYAGRCDQYVTVQERTRTCASDCGGWGGWSDWSTTNEYSQCPTDSRTDCGNCTVPPTCGNGACDNGETCSSCRTDCGVCPATAKYKCSGSPSSCTRDDANGTTTNPTCGGLCGGVSSGCPSVSLSVSPNPVYTNSPITFTATSTHAYTNANISTGGGTQGGDDFSVTGSYTWKWIYDPPNRWGNSSATAGTYNATFSGDRPGGGSACTTSTSYSVNNVVQILGQVWKDNNGNQAADSGIPWNDLRIKDPAITGCAQANSNYPLGLAINYSGPTSGSTAINKCQTGGAYYDTTKILPLPAGQSYQVSVSTPVGWYIPNNPRTVTFNGSGEGNERFWLNPPPENPNFTLPACNINPPNVWLSWTGTNSILWVDVSIYSNFSTYVHSNVSNYLNTDTNSIPGLNIVRGTTYYWRLYNGNAAGEHVNGPSFNVPNCIGPWIQTTGGDVHSNGSINIPGGP